MRTIIVDDETLALEHLTNTVKKAKPQCEIAAFVSPLAAVDYVREHPVELAFLDVEMCGMNGIELAKRCKDARPQINIVFVTAYPDYALEAFSLHASGYLLKPASVERVCRELENLRAAPPEDAHDILCVHTFGNFEVFYNGKPLEFGRGKAKELLAYLIDRKGAGCTVAELCGILWEDRAYSISLQKQFQTIVVELLKGLRRVGQEGVVVKRRNFLAICPEKVDCDYYRFLRGDVAAINAYTGEYMTNYSWAEFTTGFLSDISRR